MGLSDPFDTTYAGAYKAGSSLGEGINSAAGDVATQMELKKNKDSSMAMLKQFGIMKPKEPTSEDYVKAAGGSDKITLTGSTEQEKVDAAKKMFDFLKIPHPQSTGLEFDAKKAAEMGMDYDSTTGGLKFKPSVPTQILTPEESAARITKAMGLAPTGTTPEVTTKGAVTYKVDKPVDVDAEWSKLDKTVNPNVATNRSPLGMAGRANMAADRAITTLNNPMVTNQEAGNVMADIASIYQGGSPTEFGMSEQGYKTIQGQAAGMLQYLTGKPTDALTPDVKARLQTVLQGMKDTNSKVIKQNLDYVEKAHSKLINSDPEKWKSIRGILENGYDGDKATTSSNQNKTSSGVGYTIE